MFSLISDTTTKRGRSDSVRNRDRSPQSSASDRSPRAQTTIDFLIAISTFVVVIGFLFSFIPGITAPFDDGQSANPIIADRTATHLASDTLTSPASAETLNGTEVTDFFGTEGGLNDELGVRGTKRLHVAIADSNGDVVTYNGVELARGSEPPTESGRVTTARRSVALDEQPCRLEVATESCSLSVRVW